MAVVAWEATTRDPCPETAEDNTEIWLTGNQPSKSLEPLNSAREDGKNIRELATTTNQAHNPTESQRNGATNTKPTSSSPTTERNTCGWNRTS